MALNNKEPKEIITITQQDIEISMKALCDEGDKDVQFITLGCPHYSLEEIREAALYLKDKKVKDGVLLMIWS